MKLLLFSTVSSKLMGEEVRSAEFRHQALTNDEIVHRVKLRTPLLCSLFARPASRAPLTRASLCVAAAAVSDRPVAPAPRERARTLVARARPLGGALREHQRADDLRLPSAALCLARRVDRALSTGAVGLFFLVLFFFFGRLL